MDTIHTNNGLAVLPSGSHCYSLRTSTAERMRRSLFLQAVRLHNRTCLKTIISDNGDVIYHYILYLWQRSTWFDITALFCCGCSLTAGPSCCCQCCSFLIVWVCLGPPHSVSQSNYPQVYSDRVWLSLGHMGLGILFLNINLYVSDLVGFPLDNLRLGPKFRTCEDLYHELFIFTFTLTCGSIIYYLSLCCLFYQWVEDVTLQTVIRNLSVYISH